jgi:hypothetical protein
MRRCPKCTWQICGKCRKARDDVLRHGLSLASTGKVKRRGLLPIGGSAPKPPTTPALFAGTQSGVPEEDKAAPEITPAGAIKQKFKDSVQEDMTSVSTVKQKPKGSTQEVTPPKSGEKRKLSRKAAKSAPVIDYSDLSDDDDYSPEPASPTLSRKRQKPKGHSNAPISSSTSPTKSTFPIQQQKPDKKGKFAQDMRPSDDIDQVNKYYGLPKGAYSKDPSQHLLSRSVPIVSNRSVRIPDVVARNFKPRKSAVEFQRELQEKVAKKLEVQFGWQPRVGDASESVSTLRTA